MFGAFGKSWRDVIIIGKMFIDFLEGRLRRGDKNIVIVK